MGRLQQGMVLLGALTFSGCISLTTVVHVQPDGSGTVTQTTVLQPAMVEMLSGFAAMGQQEPGAKPPDLFPEKDLRSKAAQMGPGVTFVSSRKIKDARGEGVEAVYAFKDVSTLRIQEKPSPPSGGMPAPAEAEGDTGPKFSFQHLPNGHALLTIIPEKGKKTKEPAKEKAAERTSKEPPSPEQMAQVKKMLKGMHIAIEVDAGKKLVRTNSPYVNGNRVTLLDLDFEALLTNPDKLRELVAMGQPESLEEAKKALQGVPGIKIALEPKIEIEFE
jgi:hypothetical protein